jgi:hypothetical protein
MKRFFLFLIILLVTEQINTHNRSVLYNLQEMQTDYILKKNSEYGITIQKAFKTFHTTSKNSKSIALLRNIDIANLFLLAPQKTDDSTFNTYTQTTQQIMLVYLYFTIFNDYIARSEQFIEQLICSLDYWKNEMFYDKLPLMRKHPTYWCHSHDHKRLVKEHVQILEKTKEHATCLLGIALHGKYELCQIKDHDDILVQLTKSLNPLLQHFQVVPQNIDLPPKAMFQDTIWLTQNMQEQLKIFKKILHSHQQPHHLVRHGFLYSCIAATTIAAYITYKVHEDKIPEYKQKIIEKCNYLFKEYIEIPAADLIDVVWEQKNNKLVPFKKPKDLPTDHSWKTWIIDQRINDIFIWWNEFMNNIFEGGNANLEVINKTGTQQRLTLASAAISPAIIAIYVSYRISNHTYNKYVKHESWYRPMQLIMREIDKILNKLITNPECSYADDGMLHILTLQLKTFISCLPNEELQLIEEDLRELLTYHLNYEQKRGVMQRMYRNYEFLK